jgi:hypothetical protein
MKKLIFSILLFFGTFTLMSQNADIIQFSRLNPLSNFYNPAAYQPVNGYVCFPFLSNLNFSFQNSGFKYDNLFKLGSDGTPSALTVNNFVNSLSDKNNILAFNMNEEIIGFGFRVKNLFFTYSQRFRYEFNYHYSQDLFGFLALGNLNYLGSHNPANIDMRFSTSAYSESSIGVHIKLNDHIYIGIRPKYISGYMNIDVNELTFKLYTDPNDYSLKLNYNGELRFSTPVPIFDVVDNRIVLADFSSLNSLSEIFNAAKSSLTGNSGAGIDLGFLYRINNNFGVSVSAMDIGFIKWRTSTISIKTKPLAEGEFVDSEGNVVFEGLTTEVIDKLMNGASFSEAFGLPSSMDTFLQDLFVIEELPHYFTSLTTKLGVEGYYQINESNRFSALLKGFIVNKTLVPSLTIAYNGNFGGIVDVTAAYSMTKSSYANLGIGLGLRLGSVHLYGGSNNVLAAINPLNASLMNVQFGLLFDWGYKKAKEKKIEY